jgi:hypothetical protein
MTLLIRPPVGREVSAHIKPSTIVRSLARYPVRQTSIFALSGRNRRLAELAVTFPGLLFALATRNGDGAFAIELAIAGAPLKRVATAAGVPLWLRKLPPEAFVAPLAGLPDSERFRLRIANHLPRSPKSAASWLFAVRMAAEWADDDLAVWIAREISRECRGVTAERLQLLSLYGWFSRRPHTIGYRFTRKPWDAEMGYHQALEEAEAWRKTAVLNLELAGRDLDPWLTPDIVMGCEFVPLLTADALAEEAKIMRNCVQNFGYRLASNRQRLWSIRCGGERVATLSIACRPIPEILQLKGPANAEAAKEIWVAALRWINQHDLMAIEQESRSARLDRQAWITLWRPYWLDKQRIPSWLPLAPCHTVLGRLCYARE